MRKMLTAAAFAVALTGTAYAAGPGAASSFQEIATCPNTKGTWWKQNPAEKYTLGHNTYWRVVNGQLETGGDWGQRDNGWAPKFGAVKAIERRGAWLVIKTSSGGRWEVQKSGNGFSGTSFPQDGTPSNLELTCS